MQTLFQDPRFGARMLIKNPAVTLVAIVALTLGIGANTAIFSVVHAVLVRSLPYEDGERLAVVWEHRKSGMGNPQNVINLGNFFDWKEQNNVFVDMALVTLASVTSIAQKSKMGSLECKDNCSAGAGCL
ncbi:MAG: hypothetical protein AABN95_13960 [Acidobacteriota bacterium]